MSQSAHFKYLYVCKERLCTIILDLVQIIIPIKIVNINVRTSVELNCNYR